MVGRFGGDELEEVGALEEAGDGDGEVEEGDGEEEVLGSGPPESVEGGSK